MQSHVQAVDTHTSRVITHLQRINKEPVAPLKSSSSCALLQLKTQAADALQSGIKHNVVKTVGSIGSSRINFTGDAAALGKCVSEMKEKCGCVEHGAENWQPNITTINP